MCREVLHFVFIHEAFGVNKNYYVDAQTCHFGNTNIIAAEA